MKAKIQTYLKHRFPLMSDHLVDDIAQELETELAKEDQEEDDKELSSEQYQKIMTGENEDVGPSIDLGINKSE